MLLHQDNESERRNFLMKYTTEKSVTKLDLDTLTGKCYNCKIKHKSFLLTGQG